MTTREPPIGPKILAETTVVVVEDRGDGTVDLQMGAVILRLDRRAVASLAGTLRKVTKMMFPKQAPVGSSSSVAAKKAAHLRLVPKDVPPDVADG